MLRSTGSLRWIESTGGVLLLLGRDYLPQWEGIQTPSARRGVKSVVRVGPLTTAFTDYDRARVIVDYLGLIDVGRGHALVIDARPMATTWWSGAQHGRGGMLVRYIYADDEPTLLRQLTHVPDSLWQPTGIVFNSGKPPQYLFDPLYAGSEVTSYITTDLRPDQYAIDTAWFEPDRTTNLLLHRFRPL